MFHDDFFDFLRNGSSAFDPNYIRALIDRALESVICHVDTATNNFFEQYGKDDVWSLTSLGCIMPPYHVTFATTNRPQGPWMGVVPELLFPRRWGVLFLPDKLKPPCFLVGVVVGELAKGNFLPNIGGFEIELDEHGCAVDGSLSIRFPNELAGVEDMEVWVQCMVFPVLYAMSLMHCRNIVAVPHESSRELNAKRRRSGKPPLLRYRTLAIDPTKTPKPRTASGAGTGEGVAWHKCRGHKRVYGGENGLLFGKYACSVWIPNHVRGDTDKGVVIKDYKI